MHWSVCLLPVSNLLIRQTILFCSVIISRNGLSIRWVASQLAHCHCHSPFPFPFLDSHLSITRHLSFSSSRHFSLYLPLLHMTFSIPHSSLKYSMQIFPFVPHFLHFSSLWLFHALSLSLSLRDNSSTYQFSYFLTLSWKSVSWDFIRSWTPLNSLSMIFRESSEYFQVILTRETS